MPVVHFGTLLMFTWSSVEFYARFTYLCISIYNYDTGSRLMWPNRYRLAVLFFLITLATLSDKSLTYGTTTQRLDLFKSDLRFFFPFPDFFIYH